MSEHFTKPKCLEASVKAKLDLSNYATNAKIKNIEDKIPNITNLATNATFNAKINEVKNKIPSITNLALLLLLILKEMRLKTKYLILLT